MTEKELVRHLADAKEANDAAVRRWMDVTPAEEVTKVLHSIASRALGNSAPRWMLPVLVILQIVSVSFGTAQKTSVLDWIPQFLYLLGPVPLYIIWIDKHRLRKTRRAVFFLAEHDPVRSVELLVLWFQRRGSDTIWDAKIETTLTDVLDKSLESAEAAWDQPRLYEMVEAIAGKEPLHKAPADMDGRRTYLLIAAIRLLARVGGWKNRDLLQGIAKQSEPDAVRFSNRRLIYDCAVQCLAPPLVSPVTSTPTTALSASTPASPTPTVSIDPLPPVFYRS